jgi:hypothetical protein
MKLLFNTKNASFFRDLQGRIIAQSESVKNENGMIAESRKAGFSANWKRLNESSFVMVN